MCVNHEVSFPSILAKENYELKTEVLFLWGPRNFCEVNKGSSQN
jgi:hypothetical protein